LPGMNRPVLAPSGYALENAQGERVALAHPGLTLTLVSEHPGLAPGLYIQSEPVAQEDLTGVPFPDN